MSTNYDAIADRYKEAKLQPWRSHIERHTLLGLLGNLEQQKAVDMACGEGYYTRDLRRLGAEPVLGIDLSRGMIELAQTEERRQPLGIAYRVGDARTLELEPGFDVVFAAYLLNYAQNASELLAMCQNIAGALKSGARFVAANNNPEDPPENFNAGRQYGFEKRLVGPFREGAPIIWSFHLPEQTIEVTNYLLSTSTVEHALHAAGFTEICWHKPRVSAEGQRSFGEQHWMAFLELPPVVFLSCTKA